MRTVNGSQVNMQRLERCIYDRVGYQGVNAVVTVETKVHHAIFTATDSLVILSGNCDKVSQCILWAGYQ